ncbi:MAG: hypothetical protein LBT01_06880, partial [Spirochaetaceae bacterium]|nr:hypothetical protein [Spirochaetaceae bacterium]
MKRTIVSVVFMLFAGLGYAQQAVVAVAPFEAISGNSVSDANTIAEIFGMELQARRVVRVTTRANFEAVMKEHKFQISDLSDDKKTAELGKGMNANWIVRGQVQKLGTMIVVTASLLDVNTLEIMGGAPMYLNSIEEVAVKMDGFINQITQRISGGAVIRPGTTSNKTYKIGDRGPAGGWIFYDKGVFSNGWRYLESAPAETEFQADWGAAGKDVSGTGTAVGTGKRNTQIIVAFCRNIGELDRAAELCDA